MRLIMALPVPFKAVHLLFINLLTDSLPAIALGVEPHSSDVMNEKPRPKNQSILTKKVLTNICVEGVVIGVMTMIAFYCRIYEEMPKLQVQWLFQHCVCQDLYMALIVNRINLFGLQKRCGTIKV